MNDIKALIVDDEPDAAELVAAMVDEYGGDIKVAGIVNSVASAKEAISNLKPDLVFLDIQMPDGSGFDVISQSDHSFSVVFITAHDEHALDAFRVSAADYLLKPLDPDVFEAAIKKARAEVKGKSKSPDLDLLVENANNPGAFKLSIPVSSGYKYIDISEITHLQASGRYSIIHTIHGTSHVVAKSLGEYETMLGTTHFFRSHKSFLVNLEHVAQLVRETSWQLQMSTENVVMISRSKLPEFRQLMKR